MIITTAVIWLTLGFVCFLILCTARIFYQMGHRDGIETCIGSEWERAEMDARTRDVGRLE